MSVLGDLGRLAWRLWRDDGVPSSGPQEPLKTDILAFAAEVEKRVDFVIVTSSRAVVAGENLMVDTSAGSLTLTLPADPTEGDAPISFVDAAGSWITNALTVDAGDEVFSDGGGEIVTDGTGAFTVFFFDGKWQVR